MTFKTTTTMNKINLSPDRAEEIFFDALCDGMHYFSSYSITVDYSEEHYAEVKQKAKAKRQDTLICYEDVLIAMLKDGAIIRLIDEEKGVDDGIWSLENIHQRVQTAPGHVLAAFLDESYDAGDADAMLQHVAYGEIIFG
jgi:hypothetical protein